YELKPVTPANIYLADDVPLNESTIFTLPIHQRSKNFTLRVFNDSPFPVSLNSMMWEGNTHLDFTGELNMMLNDFGVPMTDADI
mgnify:CR=1